MFKRSLFIFIFLINFLPLTGQCEIIPDEWRKIIVPIEKQYKDDAGNINYRLHGTGFLVAKQSGDKYNYFLITNKHLLENEETIYIKFKKQNKNSFFRFEINLKDKKGNPCWKSHVDSVIDVAACRVNLGGNLDVKALTLDKFKISENLIEGDRIVFYGFPQIAYENSLNISKPAVRDGVISLIGEKYYLVDAMVFPGNSGSPVFQPLPDRNQAVLVARPSEAYLIGIVAAYKNMLKVQEYNGSKYLIHDNAGLGVVFPAEKIKETIDLF